MFLQSNLGFGIPILILILCFLGYLMVGRDPSGGPMVVQFDPPDGLSGPEAGAMLDESVDQRDLTAGIISLAVKGYLTISETQDQTIFKHSDFTLNTTGKAAGADLTDFETELLRLISQCPNPISNTDLSTNVAPEIMTLKSMLYRSLVTRGYYVTSPAVSRGVFIGGGIVITLLLGLLCVLISPLHNQTPSFVGGLLSLPIVFIFGRLAPCRTPQGAKTWQLLRGFEDFMRRARAPELDWMAKQHPDAALFEKYLPHAVAFGLTQNWSRAFDGIVTQPPSWYYSPYGNTWSMLYFANSMNSMTTNFNSAAFVPPRSSGASGGSSGFGGGGFSGGGFGGGGGGSW